MNNNYIKIYKINDEYLINPKYYIYVNGKFYAGNMSNDAKNRYMSKFRRLGYTFLKEKGNQHENIK